MLRTFSSPRVLILGAALCAAPAAWPAVALAQTGASDTTRVTQLFKSGKVAFGKGDMAEAERLFAEAFALRKSSDIAANLGQSELEQQKYRAAAEHFQWALVNLLPSATDVQRKAVETGLARSRAEVAVLRLEIKPDGAEVLVGEQNVGLAPITAGVYVDPGEVIVAVKRPGFVDIDKRVIAAKGTEQAVEVTLVPKEDEALSPAAGPIEPQERRLAPPPSPELSSDRSSPKSLLPAFVATGVAVAGGALGVGFMLSANSKKHEADDLLEQVNSEGGCGSGAGAPASLCEDLVNKRKSVDGARNIELVAFVAGGVAALAAGYFYWDALTSRDEANNRADRARCRVVPSVGVGRGAGDRVTLGAANLTLMGTF